MTLDDVKSMLDNPIAFSAFGAAGGSGLAWLYDKLNKRNGKDNGSTSKRVAIGALLGALGGTGASSLRYGSMKEKNKNMLDHLYRIRGIGLSQPKDVGSFLNTLSQLDDAINEIPEKFPR